jgi:hypothetical protein
LSSGPVVNAPPRESSRIYRPERSLALRQLPFGENAEASTQAMHLPRSIHFCPEVRAVVALLDLYPRPLVSVTSGSFCESRPLGLELLVSLQCQ